MNCQLTALVLMMAATMKAATATQEGTITREVDPSVRIAISISGFTGEALEVLKFDLPIQGFTLTSPEQCQFEVTGSSTDHVQGRVIARASKAQVLAMTYPASAPLRRQAHAFADDIVKTLRHGQIPIGQTKIGFKMITGRNSEGQVSEIWFSDFDGHNAKQLTHDNSIVQTPRWVPGHWRIYFTSYKLGNPDIYSYALETGERRIIARYTGLNTSPAVSPDGQRVAMILSKMGSPDLYVSDANGGNLKQLTTTKAEESSPCWSPDGSTLCVVSRQSGRAALYTIAASGGALQRLPTPGAINTTEPDWSPDGRYIAFTAQMGGFQICVLDRQTGSVLTGLAAGEDPSWAPNSRTLVFCHRSGNKYLLSLLDVPTQQVKDITQISGSCSQPCWAR